MLRKTGPEGMLRPMSAPEGKTEAAEEPSDKSAAGKKKRDQLDEKTINSPSMQDLVMLGVICTATLIFWAAGRAACNYHVPGESLTPREVKLEERTRMPKNVGVEFAQAISGGDFETAAALAAGDAVAFVKSEKEQCSDCSKRKAQRDKIMSVGSVLEANSVDSLVEVRTVAPAGEVKRLFGIEREERKWRVTRVYEKREDAELKEAPAPNNAPPSIRRPDQEDKAGSDDASDGEATD